jgi:alkylresorcinol/alkylpyrone synthase
MNEDCQKARSCPHVAIAAVASAVPEHRIDQRATRDIVLSIAPELRSHEPLFLNTGIKTRYSCVPLEWHFEQHGWAARNAVFQEAAVDLLENVSRKCIARSAISIGEIEAIVAVSTTGLAVPSLDAILANRLGFSSTIERLPIFGLGCAGGVSGLGHAARLAQTLRNGIVLLLVVELCTINCRNTDRSIKNFISTALFGDGAAALLLRPKIDGEVLPHLIGSGQHMWRRTESMMGWSIEDDGFGVVLSPDIPRCARDELQPAVDHFLARHDLKLADLDGLSCIQVGAKYWRQSNMRSRCPAKLFDTHGTCLRNMATCPLQQLYSCSSVLYRQAHPAVTCLPHSGQGSQCHLLYWTSDQ